MAIKIDGRLFRGTGGIFPALPAYSSTKKPNSIPSGHLRMQLVQVEVESSYCKVGWFRWVERNSSTWHDFNQWWFFLLESLKFKGKLKWWSITEISQCADFLLNNWHKWKNEKDIFPAQKHFLEWEISYEINTNELLLLNPLQYVVSADNLTQYQPSIFII